MLFCRCVTRSYTAQSKWTKLKTQQSRQKLTSFKHFSTSSSNSKDEKISKTRELIEPLSTRERALIGKQIEKIPRRKPQFEDEEKSEEEEIIEEMYARNRKRQRLEELAKEIGDEEEIESRYQKFLWSLKKPAPLPTFSEEIRKPPEGKSQEELLKESHPIYPIDKDIGELPKEIDPEFYHGHVGGPILTPLFSVDLKYLAPEFSYDNIKEHWFHHHHMAAVKLNSLIKGNHLEDRTLLELAQAHNDVIRTLAVDILAHNLFWDVLVPFNELAVPIGKLGLYIAQSYGSYSIMQQHVLDAANDIDEGYIWIVLDKYNRVHIVAVEGSYHPITFEDKDTQLLPLLVIDLYKHAYEKDYGDDKEKYLATFWNMVDWGEINRWVS